MITYIKGDLLSSPDKYIAHGVNCCGVMGSGVAKAIRENYPKAFLDYRYEYEGVMDTCGAEGQVRGLLGQNLWSVQPNGKTIINCFTQLRFGRNPSFRYVSYDAIDECMNDIFLRLPTDVPISMPKIGSGLGNGKWEIIEKIIDANLKNHIVNIYHLE